MQIADQERALVRGSIAADFVHRINNLVGTIPGWVGMAKRKLGPRTAQNEPIWKDLDRIENETRVVLKLAQDLENPMTTAEILDLRDMVGSIVGQTELVASPEIS